MPRCVFFTFLVSLALASIGAAPTDPHATLSTAIDHDSFHPGQRGALAVIVDIKDGFHAQSNTPSQKNYIAFKVTPDENPNVTFDAPIYPAGKDANYAALGVLNVYTGRVTIFVQFTVKPDAPPGELTIGSKIIYQICDDRTCFLPQRPHFETKTTIVPADQPAPAANADIFAEYHEPTTARSVATQPASANASGDGGNNGDHPWTLFTALGIAFWIGLLFNIMPCVLPVLPLKAMGFYEASQHDRSRSVMLGVVFSLGVIAVFALLGVCVLVLGLFQWGDLFANPWFVWFIVALLVAMAFSLFGAYTFSLPVGVYRFQPSHDTISGNFLMGGFTAILATPCTAPLLPALLLWAIAQPPTIGILSMIVVGVGMAFPYLLLSALPEVARRLPRTGPFSELFKQMMGFLLLVAAAYFAGGRLIHGPGFWWIVTAAAGVACAFLIVRTIQLAPRGLPIGVSLALAVLLVGALATWTIRVNREAKGWTPYSVEQFDAARAHDKIVLVKFTANWCATCQYIEGTVYHDPAVWSAMTKRGVVALKADMTDEDAPARPLLVKLNPAGGIPLTAIFTPARKDPIVLSSVYSTDDLLHALDEASSGNAPVAQAR